MTEKIITRRDGIDYEVLSDADPCDCDCHRGLADGFTDAPEACVECMIAQGIIRPVAIIGDTTRRTRRA